jgi:hypothetical protein
MLTELKQIQRIKYWINIVYTRPDFTPEVIFLEPIAIKSSDNPEKLRRVFRKAFNQIHPTWQIRKVEVKADV